VAEADDEDQELVVVDLVDDSVVADANTPAPLVSATCEPLDARGARLDGKSSNSKSNALAVRFGCP